MIDHVACRSVEKTSRGRLDAQNQQTSSWVSIQDGRLCTDVLVRNCGSSPLFDEVAQPGGIVSLGSVLGFELDKSLWNSKLGPVPLNACPSCCPSICWTVDVVASPTHCEAVCGDSSGGGEYVQIHC